MYEPLPVIREVFKASGDVADSWALAAWFHYPNAWIAGPDGVPAAPKDALGRHADGDAVHARYAALMRECAQRRSR